MIMQSQNKTYLVDNLYYIVAFLIYILAPSLSIQKQIIHNILYKSKYKKANIYFILITIDTMKNTKKNICQNPKYSDIQKQLQLLEFEYPGQKININVKVQKSKKQFIKKDNNIDNGRVDDQENIGQLDQGQNDQSYDNFIKKINKNRINIDFFPQGEYVKNQDKKKQTKQKKSKNTPKIKDQLQDSQQISAPSKPINPYMLFHIQKSSELKHKKLVAVSLSKQRNSRGSTVNNQRFKQKISDSLSIFQEWNQMSILQKDQYYLQYENRLWKYNLLNDEYTLLTNKKRILNPYNRFYRQTYGALQVQGKYTLKQMTQIIKQKWQKATKQQKQVFQLEFKEQKLQIQDILRNKQQRIKQYNDKLVQYQKQQCLQKMEILQKYHLAPKQFNQIASLIDNQKLLRNYQKKMERDRKRSRMEKIKQERIQANLKKLQQIRNKQILEIKLQKYQSLGVPRDILTTPFKAVIKQTSTSTTISKPEMIDEAKKKQKELQSQQSIELEIEGRQQIMYNDNIEEEESQGRSYRVPVPGVSSFKRIMDQLRQQELFPQL